MKKILTFVTLLTPNLAFAEKLTENSNDLELIDFLIRIKNYLLGISASVAVLFLILGGLQYITSAGNESRIKTAKQTITFSVLGLIIIILSEFILGFLTGKGFLTIFK